MYAPYGLPPEVGEILRAKDEEIRRLDKQIEMMATMRQEIMELKQNQMSAGASRPLVFDLHRASTSFHGQIPHGGFVPLPQWPESGEDLRRQDRERDRKRSRSRERRTERRESRDRHRESRRSRDRESRKESRRSRSRDRRCTAVSSFPSRRAPESPWDRSPPRRPVLSPRRDRKREESGRRTARTEIVSSSSSSRRREEEKKKESKSLSPHGPESKPSSSRSEPQKSSSSSSNSRPREGDQQRRETRISSSRHQTSVSKKPSTSTKPSSSSLTKVSSSSRRKEEDGKKGKPSKISRSLSSRNRTKDSRETERKNEKRVEPEVEIDLEMLEEVDDDYDAFDVVSEDEVVERTPTPDDGLSAYERMQRKLQAIPNDLDEYLTEEEDEEPETTEPETTVEDSPTLIQISQKLNKHMKKKVTRQAAEIAKRLESGQKLSKNQKKAIRVGSLQITVGGREPGRLVKVLGPGTTATVTGKILGKNAAESACPKTKTTVGQNPTEKTSGTVPALMTTVSSGEDEGLATTAAVLSKEVKKTTVPSRPADSSIVLGEATEGPILSKRQQTRKRKGAAITPTVPKKVANIPTVSKGNPLVIDLTSGHRVENVTPAPRVDLKATVTSLSPKSIVVGGPGTTATVSSGLATNATVSSSNPTVTGGPEKTTTVARGPENPITVSSSPAKTSTVSSSNSTISNTGPETKSTVWQKDTGPQTIPTLSKKPIPSLMDVPVQAPWSSHPPSTYFDPIPNVHTYSNPLPTYSNPDPSQFAGPVTTYFEPQAYSNPAPTYSHPYYSQPAPVQQPMNFSDPSPPMQFLGYGQPVQDMMSQPPVPGMSTSTRADWARQAESFLATLKTIQNRDGLVEGDLKKETEEKRTVTQGTVDLTTHVTLDKSGAPVPRLTTQILGGSGGHMVQRRRKAEIKHDEDEYDMIFK